MVSHVPATVLVCVHVYASTCIVHTGTELGTQAGSSCWLLHRWYASAVEVRPFRGPVGSAIMTDPRNLGCVVPAEVEAWGWGLVMLIRWSLWESCQSPALDLDPLLVLCFQHSPPFYEMPWISPINPFLIC